MVANSFAFQSANSTLILNGVVIENLSLQGDSIVIEYVNPRGVMIAGTDNSATTMDRADAFLANVTIRLLRGSPEDITFNQWIGGELMTLNGTLKVVYASDGESMSESFRLENGVFTTQPKATHNGTDLTNMSIMEYVVQFRSVKRML